MAVSEGGACRVPVRFTIVNRGEVLSPAASTARWSVAGHPPELSVPTGRISAGGQVERQVELKLFPGSNRITLVLDPDDRIRELDEHNNRAELTVRLSGVCGGLKRGHVPPPTPGMRAAPDLRATPTDDARSRLRTLR
ncbi:MAG: hypothetical protein G8D58_04575 [gamma proteobacterium symbiont of Phacoides pectinatus]